MKILHIFDHSVPLHSGYTFRSRAILEHQHAMGWKTCHLTSIKHNQATGRDVTDREEIEGLTFYRSFERSKYLARLPIINQFEVVSSLSNRLDQVIKIERPDILHAHSPCLNGLAAIKAGSKYNIPVVYECRAFWEDAAVDHGTSKEWGIRYRITRALETKVFNECDAVTTICEGLRSDIIKRGIPGDKITVIPNAVDLDRFSVHSEKDIDLQNSLGITGKIILGFIGSFYAYEGLDLLIKAFPKILANNNSTRLLMIGGGPQEDELKSLAKKLGLESEVIFTGRVPHEVVQKYYNLVDIFIYPRLSMRLTDLVTPLKPLEAMAKKRLVIASDVGGHKELIQDGVNGRLFKAGDPNDLVRIVQELLATQNQWEEIQGKGRYYVEHERNWEVSVQRYRRIYQNLINKINNEHA